MKQISFRAEVINRKHQRLQGDINLIRPTSVKWLTLLLASLVVVSVLFLSLNEYNRKTSVVGVLQPQKGLVRLAMQAGGVVANVLVVDGQHVKAGTPLLVTNRQTFDSNQNELSTTLVSQTHRILEQLQQEKVQLNKHQQLETERIQSQITSLQSQKMELIMQLQISQERLNLNKKQLERLQSLSSSGYISEIEIARQQDNLLALQQQQQELLAQKIQLTEHISQLYNQQKQQPLMHQQTVASIDKQLVEKQSQLTQLSHQQSNVLTAPIDGVISGLQLKTGQQANSGQYALTILPAEQALEAVLFIPTANVGFVSAGQTARLRYHAYPYQRFGVYEGKVLDISESVLMPDEVSEYKLDEPSFRIRVGIPAQYIEAYQRRFTLRSGMTLDADLITEQRSLLQWLFDPIYRMRGKI